MSGDASLRSILSQTDASAQNIQRSAASMMRLYDRSATVAVNEWRNTLQSCNPSQLLPLLYVANEVLQNSKRNRGTKFLEAFSPALSSSLDFMVKTDPSIIEKVRRTAKIWGDRRVFSIRYVSEILKGLEPFRQHNRQQSTTATTKRTSSSRSNNRFSSGPSKANVSSPSVKNSPASRSLNTSHQNNGDDAEKSDNEDDDDISVASLGESPFVSSPNDQGRLNVNLVIHKQSIDAAATVENRSRAGIKRRIQESGYRNNKASKLSGGKRSRRLSNEKSLVEKRKALSSSSLYELLEKLIQLNSQHTSISGIIASITSSDVFQSNADDDVTEVGDELIELNTQVSKAIANLIQQKRVLYDVAQEIHFVETELTRYIPWLKVGLDLDEEEIRFCIGLENKMNILQVVHGDAKEAREIKRKKEAKEKAILEEAARKKAEEEELERSLQENMMKSKQNASTPGMVFNRTTREYQYVGDVTEESWRD